MLLECCSGCFPGYELVEMFGIVNAVFRKTSCNLLYDQALAVDDASLQAQSREKFESKSSQKIFNEKRYAKD